jgi:D-alanine-D-alanine ligase
MRVAVLFNEVPPDAAADAADVQVQVAAVAAALRRLGHEPIPCGCTIDLTAARPELERIGPDLVFNLVESLGGTDRHMHLGAQLLETLGLPFSGSTANGILTSSDKLRAKRLLLDAGLATPPAATADEAFGQPAFPGRFILKPIYEHASLSIEDDAVIDVPDLRTLRAALRQREQWVGRPLFAEQFISGRELNVSLIADATGPRVLPIAEIDFSSFPPDKQRIVGYAAKWLDDSFEYRQTPRRFDFAPSDQDLLHQVAERAIETWHLFKLRGYARVDFRVDPSGTPWILEANANPCLSPDAGFAAAVERAGWSFDEVIAHIVEDALQSQTASRYGRSSLAEPRRSGVLERK